MRILYINGIKADIDEQTAIGIDIQIYDVKDPSNNKVNVSNNFTLPKTAQNLNIFGFANNVHSASNNIYNSNVVNYYVDNQRFITNGLVRVTEVSDRINCTIKNANTIWDTFKTTTFDSIKTELFNYLCTLYSYPKSDSLFSGTLKECLDAHFIGKTEGLHIPFMAGNLTAAKTDFLAPLDKDVEAESEYVLNINSYIQKKDSDILLIPTFSKGAHFCCYVKDIFRFLQSKYSIEFYTDTDIAYNIWDDTYANKLYIRLPDIILDHVNGDFYIYSLENNTTNFEPYSMYKSYESKTIFDFIKVFMQSMCLIKKDIDETHIRLSRFDELLNKYPIDFSDNLNGVPMFKPEIDGFGQKSYIKYKSLAEGLGEYVAAKEITCLNKNIESVTTVAEIESYVPSLRAVFLGTDTMLDMSTEESLKEFTMLINDDKTALTQRVLVVMAGIGDTTYFYRYYADYYELDKAAIYSVSNEYNLLAAMAQYPRVFEVQKWLKLSDIIDLDLFNIFYFKELGASFFINKIKGFNPQNSKEPTTLELIQASYKTPLPVYASEWFVDGVDEAFTDGNGNYFY